MAYLSQSIYGKYGNPAYTGVNKEVYNNNHDGFYTGCSAGIPSAVSRYQCLYTYEKEGTGTGASTTGNIYGVYDMSGGSAEYVMGNMKANGNLEQLSGYQNDYNRNSGFTGINSDGTRVNGRTYPASKYYDSYDYILVVADFSNNYIKGDATYEVISDNSLSTYTGWYSDFAYYAFSAHPWFMRGGSVGNNTAAGVFSFHRMFGHAAIDTSFRLVLVPTI